MSNYNEFASVYDSLMRDDVDYKSISEYIKMLFIKHDRMPKLMLDVACGTGGFSIEFSKMGAEVIGVDMSEEMLAKAKENSEKANVDILYLCQKAEEMDLYGTVDGSICCLDSINHIIDYDLLCEAFKKVSLFLEKDRLFIFDVNTVYKHKEILADNTFVIDEDDVYCVWNNLYNEENHIVDISLDFFIKNGDNYTRSGEDFSERAYTSKELSEIINNSGLEIVAKYDFMTTEKPKNNSERVVYVTKKK